MIVFKKWSDFHDCIIQHNDILYIYTLAASSDRLQKLLQLVDFSHGLKIHTVMGKDHPAILNVINSKHLQLYENSETLLHYLPAAEALNFDLTWDKGVLDCIHKVIVS